MSVRIGNPQAVLAVAGRARRASLRWFQVRRGDRSAKRRAQAIAVFGLGLIVAVLAGLVWHSGRPDLVDREVGSALFAQPGSALRAAASVVSTLGSAPVSLGVAVAAGVWLWRRRIGLGGSILAPMSVAVATVGDQLVKHVVARARPVTAVLAHESGFSFPSEHATAAAALTVSLVLMAGGRRRLGWAGAGVVYVIAVGGSRLVLGVHYLSDIVAAVGLGAATAVGVTGIISTASRSDPALT